MKKVFLFVILSAVTATLLLITLSPGLVAQGAVACSGAVWCSSDQWGNTSQFTPFVLYNNMWGAPTGTTQTIAANSYHQWTVLANYPETGGVKSYPNVSLDLGGRTISGLGSCTSSFNVSVPTSGSWAVAYDLWVPSEVMIWMDKNGAVSPIAAAWDSAGNPIPSATNVVAGGHTWNVYRGGNNVVSFVRTSDTTSATVDILAVLNWIRNQGWITDGPVRQLQFGFEITSAPNGLQFDLNSYSMSCAGMGGGTNPTATRTSAIPTNTPIRTNTPGGATATRTPTRTATRTATRTNTPGGATATRLPATPTSSSSGSTCTPVNATITAPFTYDGAGTFCWRSNNLGSYINSWNLTRLTVNGVDFTNKYAFVGGLPPKASDGYWYISYSSSVAWGHFEVR